MCLNCPTLPTVRVLLALSLTTTSVFCVRADQTSSPTSASTQVTQPSPSTSAPSDSHTDSSITSASTGKPAAKSIAHKTDAKHPSTAHSASRSGSVDRSSAGSKGSPRAQRITQTALSFRGMSYRWGGNSPRSGFDCSGLVQSVYAKWGIMLPRCASEQYSKGISIPKDKLQPGDIVFFKNTYKRGLSHVGIYIGDHWFVHAASTRKGVIMSRLDTGYHSQHWAGARRLDLSKLPPVPGEKNKPQEPVRVFLEDANTTVVPVPAPSDPPLSKR